MEAMGVEGLRCRVADSSSAQPLSKCTRMARKMQSKISSTVEMADYVLDAFVFPFCLLSMFGRDKKSKTLDLCWHASISDHIDRIATDHASNPLE